MSTNLHIVSDKKEILEKEKYITTFIKSLAAVEEAMEPFKDQKRDLRQNYIDNGWLSKEELRMAVRAYRLIKNDTDMDQLLDFFEHVKKTIKNV